MRPILYIVDMHMRYPLIAAIVVTLSCGDDEDPPDPGTAGAGGGGTGGTGAAAGSGGGGTGGTAGAGGGGGGTAGSGGWSPPIGIPAPEFGIFEEVDDDEFTHWVDNTATCADDTDGTPADPRCTIPTTLAAGSIVQVRGGPYTIDDESWTHNGTATEPVIVRGATDTFVVLGDQTEIEITGSYSIVENVHVARWRWMAGSDHLSLRHCEVMNHPGTGGAIAGSEVSDLVVWDCEVAFNGDIPSSVDRHGFNPGRDVDNLWIVDNHIHENSGDGIQFCHGCNTGGPPNDGPSRVYIGRNLIHDDEENAIDLKEYIGPVVISENTIYGYEVGQFSGNGDAIRINDEGLQGEVWMIYNEIYDSVLCIAPYNSDGEVFVIGNVIHDCETALSSGTDFTINNTIANVDNAIVDGEAVNNIVQNAPSEGIDNSVTGCSHNLTFQASAPGSCTNALTTDPELIFNGASITGIQPTSPAKGSGLADHSVYGRFSSSYGLDIAVDRTGTPRPASAWSRGAYE